MILIEVDLQKFEQAWVENEETIIITDSEGIIILATEPSWKGLTEKQAFQIKTPENTLKRAYNATAEWTNFKEVDKYPNTQAAIRSNGAIPLMNWKISSFTNYSSVREKVNTILAFEILMLLFLFVFGLLYKL